ncbi:hypothetical protein ACFLSE_06335 [Bacteroidota bacterium]
MRKTKYIIIIVLTFILYGNTIFHDYTLDDRLVIIGNEYTLSGFQGIDDIFTEDFFSGLFERKYINLLAGGRYRPLSMATFAIEWQLIMGTPFDGIDQAAFEAKMNINANPKIILPSQKLLKDLSITIHDENRNQRIRKQKKLLESNEFLNKNEKATILSNLERMHNRRDLLLFISHLINVLLYSLTVLVLFLVLERLFKNFKTDIWYLSIPFLASLLFLIHPIHTEVIANIKGRDEIISLLGALIAMFFTLKYIEKQHAYYVLLSFVSFLLALFSKEVAITFIAIIPLSIYFFIESNRKLKYIIITLVPLILASAIYIYIRQIVVGVISLETNTELMNNSFLGMNFMEKYATVFYTLLLYLKLLFFPHPLTFDYYPYHIPIMQWNSIWPILSILLYVALGIYALIGLKRKSIISYGILFYLIALSPTSNIIFPIGVFMSERFVYVASIGFAIIIAYMLAHKLPLIVKNVKHINIALIVILILFSIKTISRNSVWQDDFTLFTHDVRISKNSAKSNTSAGGKLIEEAVKTKNKELKTEYLDRAIQYLYKAIEIHPKYLDALLLLGNAKWERYQNLDSTFKYYNLILKRNPKFVEVYSNVFDSEINKVFDVKERADQNLKILHEFEKYDPNHFKVNYYLGRIYGRFMNDLETSKKYFEAAAKIDPNNLALFKDLGVVYGMSGEFKKSAEALEKAIKIDTLDPVLKVNLAMTYLQIGDKDNALAVMDLALKMNINPNNASVLISLGQLYQNLGIDNKAKICFIKARNLNPELFEQ